MADKTMHIINATNEGVLYAYSLGRSWWLDASHGQNVERRGVGSNPLVPTASAPI